MAENTTNVAYKLVQIQRELKSPKGQYNSFGKYHYRSCEDITEAAKPICGKYNCALTLDDEVVEIGGRFYIKATAKLTDADSGDSLSTSASAREEDTKKGMDASQLTGATSSYARKYALSGLFALDDTKDSDFTNTGDSGSGNKSPLEEQLSTYTEQPVQFVCADCGKPFTSLNIRGTQYDASVVWQMAKNRNTDGVARCKECREKAGTTKEETN